MRAGSYALCPFFVNMKKKETQLVVQLVLAICLVIFGCVLVVTAFFVPPTGEIHPSVLTAFGEILTFAGAVIGVDYSYKKVELKNRDNDDDANT